MTTNSNYDQKKLQKALHVIDQGIDKFPDRLDMIFGKIYVLGQIEDYNNFTKTIIQTISHSVNNNNNNNWFWTENQEL